MSKEQYRLLRTETYKIPKSKQKVEAIHTGTFYECLGMFHRKSPHSLMRNNNISYTKYDIEPIKQYEL